LPEGAIDAFGREVVIDNVTGRRKRIDRKIATKLDDSGDLTHE